MRFSFGAVLLVVFAAVISVTAQKRTITNADLEKYKQERIRAEKEYLDTYQQLGRPSPEELRRQRDESLASTARTAEMLMERELEREKLDLQREQMYYSREESYRRYEGGYYDGVAPAFFYGGGYGGSYWDGRGSYNGRRNRYNNREDYYVSGGSPWPVVGPRTAPRPFLARPRAPRPNTPRNR